MTLSLCYELSRLDANRSSGTLGSRSDTSVGAFSLKMGIMASMRPKQT
jgi:hypothetical protein